MLYFCIFLTHLVAQFPTAFVRTCHKDVCLKLSSLSTVHLNIGTDMFASVGFGTPCSVNLQAVKSSGALALSVRRQTVAHRRPRAVVAPVTPETSQDDDNAGKRSSYGRGARFPRRLVGLYELERIGVDPNRIVVENTRDELVLSVAVGLGVVSTLGVPAMSRWIHAEAAVAGVIAAGLVVWAVDTLALNGVLARFVSLSVQSKRRVATHEAGHFLVAHLMGVPIRSYTLPTARQDAGVVLDAGKCDAYTLAALGMGGIAAEVAVFGSSEGGVEDMADVARVARKAAPLSSDLERKTITRWGLMQAVTLVRDHRRALDMVAQAMSAGRSVEECAVLIDANAEKEALASAL